MAAVNNVNDMDLMRRYAEGKSEAAFAELVGRHLNFVYSAALRYVRDPQDAQDVAQAVFIILARKIPALRHRATLTGWLYETTRFAARQSLRTKARRQAREQEAYMESIIHQSDTDPVWQQLEPTLEDAMARLSAQDRALLALRFFENKSVAETASLLGLEEWAVRKRAERSVEKLRAFFHKRGMAVPASVLTSAISANSVHAAPAGLAVAISAAAFTKGAAASTSTLTLVKGALKLMFWSKTKIAISTALALALIAGVTTVGIEKLRGHDTTPGGMPDLSKPTVVSMLMISAQFIEVPDGLLDGQNLDWPPGDSGSSTAIISATQETNLLRIFRRNRDAIVLNAPRIAFSPTPGKTVQGSVSTSRPIKNSPAKQEIGTHVDVTATLAADSRSVDLKLAVSWEQLAAGARMSLPQSDDINTNALNAEATLLLNPGQSMVIRAPLASGSLLGGAVAPGTGSRSMVIVVTPVIRAATMRFQKIVTKTKTFDANSIAP
jgi:RNA polymerase sigma factor (sigma-70 family)